MSSAEPPVEPTPTAEPADDAFYFAALRQMAEYGMDLLTQAHADPTLTLAQKADIFVRVSRAVRRTILLEIHIADRKRAAATAAPRPQRPTQDADIARANRTEPPDRGERGERVESIDRLPIATRSVPEIIAWIAKDLGPIRPLRPASDHEPRPAAAPPAPAPLRSHPPNRGPPVPNPSTPA